MNRLRNFAPLCLLTMLAACGGPSNQEVISAVGNREISDISCVQANGAPGYTCTFRLGRDVLTRRVVKRESGGWQVAY